MKTVGAMCILLFLSSIIGISYSDYLSMLGGSASDSVFIKFQHIPVYSLADPTQQ